MIVQFSLWTAGLGQTLTPVLEHGLIYGAVLSVLMGVIFLGIAYLNPEIWLNDYPPDIREVRTDEREGQETAQAGRHPRLPAPVRNHRYLCDPAHADRRR